MTSKRNFIEMNDDEEQFINSDKALLVINLLTKHKIKLWELPNIDQIEQSHQDHNVQLEVCRNLTQLKFSFSKLERIHMLKGFVDETVR